MKKIVIVNQVANYLMADIAETFVKSGKYDKVVLLVGNPDNVKSLVNEDVKVDSFYPYSRKSIYSRLWSWVRGFIEIVHKIRTSYKDYELFLVSNPATVAFIYLFLKNPYSSLTYDLYPDGFLPSGQMTEKNIVFKIWTRVNKEFFKRAQGVFCITDGMADAMAKYFPRKKIEVVQLWGNERIPIIDIPKIENNFLKKYNIEDKFILSYSGNMGQGHDLITLIEAASQVRDIDKLRILFIGEGFLKPVLIERVKDLSLEEICLFFPYQPVEMLPYSFSCSDISVVSIHRKSVSMPSKTFDIMRMSKPIIGIAEPESSLSQFIKKNDIGVVFRYNEANKLASFIRAAYLNQDILSNYAKNSLNCSKIYSKEQSLRFIVD